MGNAGVPWQELALWALGILWTALVLVGGWLVRTTAQTRDDVRVLRVILVGEDGHNGLKSELKRLGERRHDDVKAWQDTTSTVDLLEFRVAQLEKAA